MASEELKALLAIRWANRPDPSRKIEDIRDEDESDPGRIPCPGTTYVPCGAGSVYCEWVTWEIPKTESVFLYLYGGGYYRSSSPASRVVASNLSKACGCRCFTVDYRLAPENKFPAAIDDAYTAYQWLLKQGISPKQIVVGGSSAGGGLTAALLAKLKQNGDDQPAAAVLLSPWTDLTQSSETYVTNADVDPSISKDYLDLAATQYLNGADPKHPLASPIFSDLEWLPPLLIQVGNEETMYGDAEAYAEKARQADVQVEFETFDDVPHAWHNSEQHVPEIPEVWVALDRIGEFFKRHAR
jgi:monoterpene epsilon-lactone hydrolase